MRSRKSLLIVALLSTGAAVAALVVPSSAGAAPKTTIQMGQHLCKSAKAGHMSCLAMRLVTKRVTTAQAKSLEAAGMARLARPRLGFGPAGGYSPGQLAAAYGVNAGAATNQTVAIVDAFNDPTVLADLNHFNSQNGLPSETASSFKVVNQTGGSTLPGNNAGWAGEITLDVQAVRGLCHKCKILLVEANSNSNANLGTAVNYAAAHAAIVSNSYGGPEFPSDPNVSDYNHPGVAILASTGDNGWYGYDQVNAGGQSDGVPSVPASYNTVIGVGGTTLNLNPNSTRASESVWNDNGPYDAYGLALGAGLGAAGSGCSGIYNAQSWQRNVAGYGTLGCGATKRNGVDIAAEADYFTGFDIYQGFGNPNGSAGWYTIGGTSLSSPLVAALWGLAGGPAGVRYPALTLYGHYKSDSRHLYDVTGGGTGLCDVYLPRACAGSALGNPNGNPNQAGAGLLDCAWGASGTALLANRAQCYAQSGYDGVSGVGTPKGTNPFKPLSPAAVIAKPASVTHGHAASFGGGKSSSPFPGGLITSYAWNWGDGQTSSGKNVSHTYAKAGSYNVTLTVKDTYTRQNNGRVGRTTITISVK